MMQNIKKNAIIDSTVRIINMGYKILNFDIKFIILSFIILLFLLSRMNLLFSFYYATSLIGVIYIMLKLKSDFSKQYLYVSFIFFILSVIFVKINFADILGYQDQYFYINESLSLISNSNYLKVVDDFFNLPTYYRFNNWTFIHYINDYVFQDKRAIIFFNFQFHFLTVIYLWKSFRYLFNNKNIELYFFIVMLFAPPLLFIDSLYLKESFYSSLFLLLVSALKNKNIFLIIFSSFFLIKIRTSHFLLFIIISLFFRILFSARKQMKVVILAFSIAILSIGFVYISSLGNTGIKLFDYMNQTSQGGATTKVEKLQNFSMKFIDKENLLSLQNIIVLPVIGLFSPPAVRFLKVRDLRTVIESLMVTIWWWIGLPYFLIFIFEYLKINYKLTSYMLGIFLSIYLASTFSLVSIAPEIFRYRLSIFGIFIFGSFIGYNFYKSNKILFYKRILKLWFYGSSSLFLIYLVA